MVIRIYENSEQVGKAAATLLGAQILKKPDAVLGLATGSTPLPAYRELIRLYEEGILDFSRVISYNLDEYVGISPDHPQSYHRFMKDNLFDFINILPENTHVPDGNAQDPEAFCAAYDQAIAQAGGIDVQVLGIGRNGHIAFNEPGSSFVSGCHTVELTQSTIQANRRFFDSEDQVPRKAITLGIGSIMAAKQVLLLATGQDKAEAIRSCVKGNMDPQFQASILQSHPNVVVLLDQAAASLL